MTDYHYDTGPGYPQNRKEVEDATDDQLSGLMAECGVDPADGDICLACYAYQIASERSEQARQSTKSNRRVKRTTYKDGSGMVIVLEVPDPPMGDGSGFIPPPGITFFVRGSDWKFIYDGDEQK